MRIVSSFILSLLIASAAVAQQVQPKIPTTAARPSGFVPRGWRSFMQAEGDLNKDGLPDIALVLQEQDPEKIIKNPDGLGADSLDLNRRLLLILWRQPAGDYQYATRNMDFMPSPNNAENACESDPLEDSDAITIRKGVLVLRTHYWSSCGSYSMDTEDYTFRYQNGRFELIGYARDEMHRATGEMTQYSANFSTWKHIRVTGDNMFEDTPAKPKTETKQLKPFQLPQLETMTTDSWQKLRERLEAER